MASEAKQQWPCVRNGRFITACYALEEMTVQRGVGIHRHYIAKMDTGEHVADHYALKANKRNVSVLHCPFCGTGLRPEDHPNV